MSNPRDHTPITPTAVGRGVAVIDADLQPFIRALAQPAAAGATLVEVRERAERMREHWRRGGPAMASVDDSDVPTSRGAVHIRRFTPTANSTPLPALVYLHGGGWTMFSLNTHDRIMRELAARAGISVIGVDYALSPEARFPMALTQINDVVRWLAVHGHDYGIDPTRLAIGGDSSGANLAVGVALMFHKAKLYESLRGLLLFYGCFSADISALAHSPYGTAGNILTHEEMAAFWRNYLEHPADAKNPLASPLLADLSGLPPVFQAIAECDVLAAQNHEFARRLRAAGVALDTRAYAGATHSFLEAIAIAAVARRALDDSAQWLRRSLCGPPAAPPLQAA